MREAIVQGFDFNKRINGIPLDEAYHVASGGHREYTNKVLNFIDMAVIDNPTKSAKEIVEDVAMHVEQRIAASKASNIPLNEIIL